MPTSPETSMAVPFSSEARPIDPATALVHAREADEIDEDTARAALAAMRKHEIGVAIGGIAPALIGLVLLRLGAEGLGIPWQALVATMLVCVAAVPVVITSSRRAFLAECASLGVSPKSAKAFYRRVLRAQVRLEKGTQTSRDRALASSLREP